MHIWYTPSMGTATSVPSIMALPRAMISASLLKAATNCCRSRKKAADMASATPTLTAPTPRVIFFSRGRSRQPYT